VSRLAEDQKLAQGDTMFIPFPIQQKKLLLTFKINRNIVLLLWHSFIPADEY
jgi:hypothetical protein